MPVGEHSEIGAMNKLAAVHATPCHRTSGVYRRFEAGRMSRVVGERPESCFHELNQHPCDLWQCVENWIARLDLTDQRRRLLELARWRQDQCLAQTVLRQL